MNQTLKTILIIFGTLMVVGVIYIIFKNHKLNKRLSLLESDRLRLQKFLFEKYGESQHVIYKEIDTLISENKGVNPNTTKNLIRAKELCEEGYLEEGVRKLVVVIENQLKFKFELDKDEWFISLSDKKKRFVGLAVLINRALKVNIIDNLEHSLAMTAMDIRHGESHKEGFEDTESRNHLSILGSIEIIKKITPSQSLKMVTV